MSFFVGGQEGGQEHRVQAPASWVGAQCALIAERRSVESGETPEGNAF